QTITKHTSFPDLAQLHFPAHWGGRVARRRFFLGAIMTGRKTRRRDSAFTLVELLVVVAIIAILIGILVPSLSKAREQARKTVCGTKVRAWGQAFLMYAEEFSTALPLDGGDGDSTTPIGVWSDQRLWFNGLTTYMATGNRTYDQLQ